MNARLWVHTLGAGHRVFPFSGSDQLTRLSVRLDVATNGDAARKNAYATSG